MDCFLLWRARGEQKPGRQQSENSLPHDFLLNPVPQFIIPDISRVNAG